MSETINVQFVNSVDGSIIATSKIPIDQLPETFEIDTTLDLAGEKWSIDTADPTNKSEFSKSKSLVLNMTRVEMVDINDIKYSLPTISAELPALTATGSFNGQSFNQVEDNWRQIEFLPKSSLDKIEIEVDSIKEIWGNHSTAVDKSFNIFSKLHVRNSIGIPSVNVSLFELMQLFEIDQVDNLTLGSESAFVENGFSLNLTSHVLFGTVENDIIRSLCMDKINEDAEITIQKISSTFDLVFVNWYYHSVINNYVN